MVSSQSELDPENRFVCDGGTLGTEPMVRELLRGLLCRDEFWELNRSRPEIRRCDCVLANQKGKYEEQARDVVLV